MTLDEYKKTKDKLRREYEYSVKELNISFAKSNNPYNIGDKFTDHMGSIIIEKIQYSVSFVNCETVPSCVYFGAELKKDGTSKKNSKKRHAWQVNEVKAK